MIKKNVVYVILLLVSSVTQLHGLTLQRVILSTNDNPNYIEFWPMAARAWQEIVGLRPTLALIADDDVEVDTTLGDVIRFKPIEGIPTSFYAQCIRLLLPALFPDEVCITGDIDISPLQKNFFTEQIKDFDEHSFVIYRSRAYDWYYCLKHRPRLWHRYYMNFIAAKGSTFARVFHVYTKEQIPGIIQEWHQKGFGWDTDELMLYDYVERWGRFSNGVKRLGHNNAKKYRIHRYHKLKYDKKKLEKGDYYIDLNCARPYSAHKAKYEEIMGVVLSSRKK